MTADQLYRQSGELFRTGTVQNINLADLDPRVAMEGLEAIQAAKQDFPELKIGYFGSIQNQVEGIREELADYFTGMILQANVGKIPRDMAEKIGRHNADQYIRDCGLDQTEGCFAWSLSIPEGGAGSRFNGVAVNRKYGAAYDFFKRQKEQEVAVRHKPVGCDTPKATFDHEMGHEIDRLTGASRDGEILAMYRQMIANGNGEEVLSGYAATNVAEFIAEAYSEYRNNPQPREYARRVYRRLKQLAGEKGEAEK